MLKSTRIQFAKTYLLYQTYSHKAYFSLQKICEVKLYKYDPGYNPIHLPGISPIQHNGAYF